MAGWRVERDVYHQPVDHRVLLAAERVNVSYVLKLEVWGSCIIELLTLRKFGYIVVFMTSVRLGAPIECDATCNRLLLAHRYSYFYKDSSS